MQRGQNLIPGISPHRNRGLFPFTLPQEHRRMLDEKDLWTSYLENLLKESRVSSFRNSETPTRLYKTSLEALNSSEAKRD